MLGRGFAALDSRAAREALVLQHEKPLLADNFSLPSKTVLDSRLLVGAAIFGVGWGVYGYCPGPAISALAYLHTETALFLAAMLGGMAIANKIP